MRKTRIFDQILLCTVASLLTIGAAALTFFPAPRFSPSENRNLAEFPPFNTDALTNGTYTAALDTYATERFPYRRQMRSARALYLLGSGRAEVRDVVLCTDGSLSRKIAVNERIWSKNVAGLKKWQDALGNKLTVGIAPCRIEARCEVLPPLFEDESYTPRWQELERNARDLVTFRDFSDDALWYHTDHHWTTDGAYLAYCRLGKRLGYEPLPTSSFTREPVTTEFYGTSHAAAGIPLIAPDKILLYRFSGDTDKTVEIDGRPAPFEGFYDLEKLQTRDGYAVFFGGNYARLSIKGDAPKRRLLVIKDSFANALIPFLSLHFDVVAIDPRYAVPDMAGEQFDAALLLCGMQTLATTEFLK